MNRGMKAALLLLALVLLPVLALADAPVMLVNLPESAQMVENVEFENGDFIQTYQLENGITVQLLRYEGFEMVIDELIASDWPVNCGVSLLEMDAISGVPAKRAHILQAFDEGGYPVKEASATGSVMAIDLIVAHANDTTLIFQCMGPAGAAAETAARLMESLSIQGGEEAEVG